MGYLRRSSKQGLAADRRRLIPCYWRKYLTSSPDVCDGQLCAKNTRVPVTVILDNLAEGVTRNQVIHSYPSLMPEHIDAAMAYAAELAREERPLPLLPNEI